MKRYISSVLAVVTALSITGCSTKKSMLGIATNEDNTITVTMENAEKDSGGTGTINVAEGEHVYVASEMTSGKVIVNFERGDEGDKVNPPVDYEITGNETTEYVLDNLEYTVEFKVTEEANGTIKVYTDAPSYAQEEGQNPVMNFVGTYAHDRAAIFVEAGEGHQAKFTVRWGNSAAETVEWNMSGEFDEETMTVEYTDCVKKNLVFGTDGKVQSEETVYENGTGRIIFSEEGSLHLSWEDDQEKAAEGLDFGFAN